MKHNTKNELKLSILFCVTFLLIGILLGLIIKKTSSPLFSVGNDEIEIKNITYEIKNQLGEK